MFKVKVVGDRAPVSVGCNHVHASILHHCSQHIMPRHPAHVIADQHSCTSYLCGVCHCYHTPALHASSSNPQAATPWRTGAGFQHGVAGSQRAHPECMTLASTCRVLPHSHTYFSDNGPGEWVAESPPLHPCQEPKLFTSHRKFACNSVLQYAKCSTSGNSLSDSATC